MTRIPDQTLDDLIRLEADFATEPREQAIVLALRELQALRASTPAGERLKLDGNELWEWLFGRLKGNVPPVLDNALLDDLTDHINTHFLRASTPAGEPVADAVRLDRHTGDVVIVPRFDSQRGYLVKVGDVLYAHPQGERVKPLEWREIGEGYAGFIGSTAHTRIEHGWNLKTPYEYGGKSYPHLDEAKAAAQADYEQRILSALAHPQGESNAWQPIETAPKDGTEVLLWGRLSDRHQPWRYIGSFFKNRRNGWWVTAALPLDATLWQPLPPPPALASPSSLTGGRDD